MAGRGADGLVAVVAGEADALAGEVVEVGCGDLLVAIGAEDVAGVVIGDDEDEIRFAGGLRGEDISKFFGNEFRVVRPIRGEGGSDTGDVAGVR